MPHARFTVTAAALAISLLATRPVPPTPAHAGQQRPRFESTVTRVRVNVIVTDAEGRFVDDLRAEDFSVFEDGEPREVLEVQLIDVAAGEIIPLLALPETGDVGTQPRAAPTPAGPDGAASLPGPDAAAPSASDTNPVAATYGAMIFLIDFKGLDHTTKLHFTNQWERFLESRDSTTVPQAVYLIDQVGRLREVLPLTSDLDRIRAARQTIEATPLTRGAILGGDNPEDNAFEEHDRSVYSLRLLGQFCDALAARPGRTALVWVSPGVTLKGPMDSDSRGQPRMPGTQYEPHARILRLQEELYAAANTANVSIYAVDPSRLIDLGPRAGSPRDELGNSLRHAAAETGGKHFIAWADFGEVVQDIERDSGRYYLLSYPGPVPGGDGRYHDIRVEVDRPGVTIRSKEGYTDHSEEQRRSRFVSAVLTLPGTINDIPIQAELFRGAPGGDRTGVMVAVAVDGRSLEVGSGDQGRPVQQIEIHAAALDEDQDMEVAAEMHRQVTEEPAEDGRRQLLSKQEWDLPAARYDLRIMVRDTVSGRVGTVRIPFEIPATDGDDWTAGDVVLFEINPGDEPIPLVQGRARANMPAAAFIEIRGGHQPVLGGRVRTAETGGTATPTGSGPATSGVELFAQPLRRDGPWHRGSLPLPPLPPGEYILELRVDDAPAGRRHTVEIPLHVGTR